LKWLLKFVCARSTFAMFWTCRRTHGPTDLPDGQIGRWLCIMDCRMGKMTHDGQRSRRPNDDCLN
jgi:hypothetical protein